MFGIPQEELDKLNDSTAEGLFDEHAEVEEETEEEVEEEAKVEEKVSVSTEKDAVEPEETGRIPYSRFEKVNEAKIRAEERLAVLEEQLAKKNSNDSDSTEITPDDDWIELWGDNEDSRRAYLVDQRRKEKERIETTNRILEEIDTRQTTKQKELQENLNYIDDNIAQFEETLGRKLTEAEESAILDIQDEWTPKDDKGNYIAPLLSAEKAFEVYNLRQTTATAKKSLARKRVVSITGSSTDGESESSSSADYDPSAWGSWRKAL